MYSLTKGVKMISTTLKKTNVKITVIAAFLISSFAVLLGASSQANAASSYAGPVYSSYEECDAARATYQSSWTDASHCYVQYGYDTNTGQNVYLGYSFTVTTAG